MKKSKIYTSYRAQFANDFIMVVGTLQIIVIAAVIVTGLVWLSQFAPIF